MADTTIIVPMAHGSRKVENLRAFMVNLANSRGLLLPESRLFEQRFLDLCVSPTPDHPTYSAMIFTAIKELNEEGGSCQEAISEFIKSKYESLPFAHTSLLSHHLAKLVEKKEILCDYKNYCYYTLPGERKNTGSSTDAEGKSVEVMLGRNDQCAAAADQVMNLQNVEKSVENLESGNRKVGLLEEGSLTESRAISLKRKTRSGEGVAIEVEPEGGALAKSWSEGRIEANSGGGEAHELVVVDEQNDVLMMEESCKGEENLRERNSEQGKPEVHRTFNTMKEACVEVKSVAYKTLLGCQTEACSNIIALEKMLKQCREKDHQKKAVTEIDVSRLPLSMESCEELRKLAQKIESQLSKIIGSYDEAVNPCYESRGCEIEGRSKEVFHETPTKISKQHEQKERKIGSHKKPGAKKGRVKRLQDIGKVVLRKSPRIQKLI